MNSTNYINIPKRERGNYVYRTLPFNRLVEIFESEKNTLLAPYMWKDLDPFENFILQAPVDRNGTKLLWHDHFFGQCWSMTDESDAIWRIYSPDKSSVRIRTTIEKLAESLSKNSGSHSIDSFIGKVKYYFQKRMMPVAKKLRADILNVRNNDVKKSAKAFLIKRDAFKHEDEIRLIYFGNDTEKGKNIYQYSIDPHNLIESVTIDPRAPTQLVEVYSHYLRNKIKFKGDIIKSKLYDLPPAVIEAASLAPYLRY